MTDKPNKLVPALAGGAVLAVLSIIPVVNFGCCVWGILGGGVAAYMLIKRSPVRRVTTGDGALAGLLAGLFGSLIFLVINIPILLSGWANAIQRIKDQAGSQPDQSAQDAMRQMAAFMEENRLLAALLIWLIFALIAVGMAVLGGIIGVALFEKRKGDQPPPGYPPSGYPPPGYPPPNQPPY